MAETSFERKLRKAREKLAADQAALEAEKNAPKPIGVPENYLASKPWDSGQMVLDPGSGTAAPGIYPFTPPRYYQGAEFLPASFPKDKMIDLQRKLESLGLKGYTPGYWDPKSMAAFQQLLGMANASGSTWEDMLNDIEASGGIGGSDDRRDPVSIKLTNPLTLKAVLQEGAQKVFGKYMDTSIIDRIISGYQAQEAAFQTGSAEAAGYDPMTGQQVNPNPTGNTRVDAPSMAGINLQAEEMMRKEHPVTSEMAEFVSHFGDLIGKLTK